MLEPKTIEFSLCLFISLLCQDSLGKKKKRLPSISKIEGSWGKDLETGGEEGSWKTAREAAPDHLFQKPQERDSLGPS